VPRTVVFYISGHGFGHASRTIEVINALRTAAADVRIIVRTSAPQWLFDLTVSQREQPETRAPFSYHHTVTDTGIVQIDSLHLDERATIHRAREFMTTFDDRVRHEAAFLRAEGATLVVADLPPLGIAAAKRADLPVAALGNFTWDWIYSAYDGAADLVAGLGEIYAGADVAWRLPLHGGFATISPITDVPLVARRSRRDPVATKHALGLPLDEKLILVSFGGYGIETLDLDALSRLEGYGVLISGSRPLADLPPSLRSGRRGSVLPLDERALYAAGYRYEDLVRAVDVVVTKPGYGIISECAANETALLYTSRGHFIEYDTLVREMPGVVRCAYIDHADLFAGRWRRHLDALLAQPPPARPRVDGAERVAELICDF